MKVYSIQCTSCAAPLDINGGGHRIRTLTCQYCGAVMDVRKEYALLDQFTDQHRPASPLSIGMQGKIKGVDFTIIATLGMRSNFGDRWTDLFLYSPTHGYAWLTYSKGHFTFTRRVRYLPDRDMRTMNTRDRFKAGDHDFAFFESYQAEFIYVAGELTWRAKIGDKSDVSDAIAPPYMFSQESSADELEYHLTEYIDPEEIKANFDLDFEPKRRSVDPAQPFKAPLRKALSTASKIPLILSTLALLLISFFLNGNMVYSENIKDDALRMGSIERYFNVNNPKHLMELDFNNPMANQWRISELIILNNEQKAVFSFTSNLSLQAKKALSQQSGKARFIIDQKGKYTLRFKATKRGTTQNKTAAISISIREGVIGKRYFYYLFAISLVGFILFHLSRFYFEGKRWALAS